MSYPSRLDFLHRLHVIRRRDAFTALEAAGDHRRAYQAGLRHVAGPDHLAQLARKALKAARFHDLASRDFGFFLPGGADEIFSAEDA